MDDRLQRIQRAADLRLDRLIHAATTNGSVVVSGNGNGCIRR